MYSTKLQNSSLSRMASTRARDDDDRVSEVEGVLRISFSSSVGLMTGVWSGAVDGVGTDATGGA